MSDTRSAPTRGGVALPDRVRSPWWHLTRRLLMGLALFGAVLAIVYLQRRGYRDGNDPRGVVDLRDAVYYVATTLSTTGYGDIAPATSSAR